MVTSLRVKAGWGVVVVVYSTLLAVCNNARDIP